MSGLHELAYQAITKTEVDLHRQLAKNVILAGGTMQMPGMEARMQQELRSLLPVSVPAKATLLEQPQYSAFVGGSITASMCSMEPRWVTRPEYMEIGLAAIQRRCPCLLEAGEQAGMHACRA